MKRILRRWRWILAGLGGLVAVLLVTGWLMFQHIPAWYRPARISPADYQRVRDDLAATYDSFGAQLNSARAPFTFTLRQEQLNAWLASREAIDPKTREWFPPSIREPMLVLEKDAVRFGATYEDDGLQTVISARLALGADASGIRARLDEVSGGSLGVPETFVREALGSADAKAAAALQSSGIFDSEKPRPRLSALFDGIVLPNTATWAGGHRFRVIAIKVEAGKITFTLERLPMNHSRR